MNGVVPCVKSGRISAQPGKNYHNGAEGRITGKELPGLAIRQIKQAQYLPGGTAAFLETDNEEKMLSFYRDHGFRQFDSRLTEALTVSRMNRFSY